MTLTSNNTFKVITLKQSSYINVEFLRFSSNGVWWFHILTADLSLTCNLYN